MKKAQKIKESSKNDHQVLLDCPLLAAMSVFTYAQHLDQARATRIANTHKECERQPCCCSPCGHQLRVGVPLTSQPCLPPYNAERPNTPWPNLSPAPLRDPGMAMFLAIPPRRH